MFEFRSLWACVALVAATALPGCQRNTVEQRGYRGLGMVEAWSPAALAAQDAVNKVPVPLRKASASGPTAADEYQNVQVLGDLSKAEFARLMLSFKSWIAPDEGCNYCHNAPDYASDAKAPKQIARLMIGMTRRINSDWTTHVKATGVTCYTCHRGQPVPPRTWVASPQGQAIGAMSRRASLHAPTPSADGSAPPVDVLSEFLLADRSIRVVSAAPLPGANERLIRDARASYTLMMVMSESLGVNCTFCHNSRAFAAWDQSPPQRQTAWHGIRMARELNTAYLQPIAALLPAARLGPAGDAPKVFCATCHMGSGKPLNGVAMVKDFPELVATKAEAAARAASAAAAPAPASAPASAALVAQR